MQGHMPHNIQSRLRESMRLNKRCRVRGTQCSLAQHYTCVVLQAQSLQREKPITRYMQGHMPHNIQSRLRESMRLNKRCRVRGTQCSLAQHYTHSVHSAWVPRTAVPNHDLTGQEKGSRVLWTNSMVVTMKGGRKIVENQWTGHRNGVCYCLAIAGSCHVVQLGQCARDDAQVAASWKVDKTTDFWEPSVLLLRAWSCAAAKRVDSAKEL